MGALDVAVPQLPRIIDLRDAVDATDRSLEMSYGQLCIVQGWLAKVKAPGATKYLMPSNILAADRAAYETAIDTAITSVKNAIVAYIAIMALQPAP